MGCAKLGDISEKISLTLHPPPASEGEPLETQPEAKFFRGSVCDIYLQIRSTLGLPSIFQCLVLALMSFPNILRVLV